MSQDRDGNLCTYVHACIVHVHAYMQVSIYACMHVCKHIRTLLNLVCWLMSLILSNHTFNCSSQ